MGDKISHHCTELYNHTMHSEEHKDKGLTKIAETESPQLLWEQGGGNRREGLLGNCRDNRWEKSEETKKWLFKHAKRVFPGEKGGEREKLKSK